MRCCTAIVLALAGVLPTAAMETDQYYAWLHPPADSSRAVNAKINMELESALDIVNASSSWERHSCHEVIDHIIPRFREYIFKNVGVWARNTPLVETVPSSAEEELEYRKSSIYQDRWFFDISGVIPLSPTITLAGVQIGTDKLAHFFSEGHWYYLWYRSAIRSGMNHEEAVNHVVDRGMFFEKTVLGFVSSGVLSLGDLEANYQGLLFYINLCDAEDPSIQRTETGWRLRRPFDFHDYVTPEWDESYQPQIYTRKRWKHVRPFLMRYCDQLDEPVVRDQRKRYEARDRVTLTEQRLQLRVEAGQLTDPALFSIEAVCSETDLTD
jgi:hypothetical protein